MWNKRWAAEDVTRFSYKLSQLLAAGMPLLTSLSIIGTQATRKQRKACLSLIKTLEEGRSFSAGLKEISYPSFFCTLVSAAELHGQLAETLTLGSRHYQSKCRRQRKQRRALAYPFIVLLGSIATLMLIIYGVLPQFISLYHTFQIELPPLTSQTLQFIEMFQKYQFWLLGIGVVLCTFVFVIIRFNRKLAESVLLQIPFLSRLLKLHLNQFLCIQTGLMLEGGITILAICRLFSGESHWVIVRKAFQEIEKELLRGRELSQAFATIPWILPVVAETVRIAESAGTVGVSLLRAGEQLEEDMEYHMEKLTSFMESFLLIMVGLGVLYVMLSLFVPLLGFIQQI